MLVNVYRWEYDRANDGISNLRNQFYLFDEVTISGMTFSDATDVDGILVLEYAAVNVLRAIPIRLYPERKNHVWFGGNFCWSDDPKFPCNAPIKIYDKIKQ